MRIYLTILFIVSFALAEDVCKKVSRYAVECFEKKSRGELKSCEKVEPESGNEAIRKLYKKACNYGCISESLYEANMVADLIYDECTKLIGF
ncbi:hypothetical protein BCF55_1655 [Hydrogenivirga caldilitoris]|uniref:Uncharacterized protein n=1 Tax=Hydrogenivirga caldilitoris TaxID=246264 RepID=A0A497XQW5_9AQUI|nr:hypothetical protein [Hydrogenivirga caldilitoris]RLJ71355.1 hypothetical protein BCF55_1655 [Hydrogenivirga caldilitoris]